MFSDILSNLWMHIKGWNFTTLATALVYAAIIGLFVVAYLRCIRPVRYCRGKLKNAIRAVKKANGTQPWQDKYFLGKGMLYPVWCEYLNSRNFADSNYHNASPLEDYINEDTIITDPGRLGLSEAVPGLMVSLGFLGTLVGLMMGLSDFNMTNTDTTMAAIRQVVSGMRYAFTTSIVGVIASVCYSLLARAAQGSARNMLSRFYEAMHKQSGVQAVDPMTQIAIYEQEQTALVQAMAEDITGAMTDRLGAVLEMALQPLQSSLDEFVATSTQEQTRAVDAMVQRFVSSMDNVLSNEMSNFSRTLAETSKWQQDTAKYVGDVIESMRSMSYDIMQIQQLAESLIVKFEGYINRLSAAQAQANEGYAVVNEAAKAMDASAKQQFECVSQFSALHEEMLKSMDVYKSQIAESSALLARAQAAGAESLRKAADELGVNGKVLTDAHSTFIKGMNQELNRTFEIFSKDLNQITKSFRDTIGAMDDAVRDVPAILRESTDACFDEMRLLREDIDALRESRR